MIARTDSPARSSGQRSSFSTWMRTDTRCTTLVNSPETTFRGRVVWIDKSTGAQFALMPRNVVSGEFTKVVQRVPVRIAIEKDERWPLLRAGLSVQVVIAHGPGDPQWAEQAAREMKVLETQYNQPPPPERRAGTGDQP